VSDIKEHNCATCPVAEATSRRDFLRDSAIGIAGVLATLGISRSAAALPVSMIKALTLGKAGITYAIPAGDGVQIDKDNEVILVRWQNAIYAFNLSCPHQRTALRWNDAAKEFQCPKHKSKYMPTGDFISGRATRSMDRFALQRTGNNVVVDVDNMYREDEDGPQWKAAFVKV
jgi:nitrite reductase/ring-hydroxylating ferredoxin subunit